jgi:carboxymethylenebutenolidase
MSDAPVSEWTTFTCRDGFEMRAWLTRSAQSCARPGVLFVYEPFGVNAEMKRVAAEIAAMGYVVMIPDLMQRGSFFACVRALMKDLQAEHGRGVDDLLDARASLAARQDVLADRVAVVGLCMGGGFAMILAKTGLFRVAAPFYGRAPERLDGACPIVASFGARDRLTIKDAARVEDELRRLGVPHDVVVYPDAGHSFLTRPPNAILAVLGPILPARAAYHPVAAADAMRRLGAFLATHL